MIIVTGGLSGLGKAITEDLREKGEKVVTISRRKNPDDADHIPCDITNYKSLKEVYFLLNKSEYRARAH